MEADKTRGGCLVVADREGQVNDVPGRMWRRGQRRLSRTYGVSVAT